MSGLFILAKPCSGGRVRFVRSIIDGGMAIDSGVYSDFDKNDSRVQARTWASEKQAQHAADRMAEIGGPHGYAPHAIAARPVEV